LVASGRTKDELNGVIAVEDLRFDYPGTRALDGISFQLTTGSVTALVGPNGAGKTTLLRCLAALDTPHGGRILIDGIDVNNQPRIAHQRLGFLPDHFGLVRRSFGTALPAIRGLGAARCLPGDACRTAIQK
jgi:ABC-2 type transport system ATP-binding protein